MSPQKGAGALKASASAKLQGMYYQGDDRMFDRNELDVRLLKYNYALMVLRNCLQIIKTIKLKNVRTLFYVILFLFILIH